MAAAETGYSYNSVPITDRISIKPYVFEVIEFKSITYNNDRHRPTTETRRLQSKPEVVRTPKASRIGAQFQRHMWVFRLCLFERRTSITRMASPFETGSSSILFPLSGDVGRCCTLLLWTRRSRKHMVCLWNWDSICNRTQAITTSGLLATILDFRHKIISVGYKMAAVQTWIL